MSRVSLHLPAGVRVTTVDHCVAGMASALGCKVVVTTDAFGNRSYTLEPIYAKPEARKVVPLRSVPPMFPAPNGPGCAA